MAVQAAELGFDSASLDLQGLRLHAITHGDPSQPLVIVLHGFPEGWLSFRHQIRPLAAAGYRIVAPDQRGYNLTSKGGPYDLDTLASDALQLVQALGAQQAHWVGHDWGGVVAWHLAEHHPQHVRTLTILNVPHPAIGVRSIVQGNLRQFFRSLYVYFFQFSVLPEWLLRRNHFELMRRAMANSARPGTFSEVDLERYVRVWSEPGALPAMLGWYRALFRHAGSLYRHSAHIPPYTMPALLLWGEQDVALGVELAEASARLLAQGHLIRVPAATHWVQHDFPELTTQHILDNLRRG